MLARLSLRRARRDTDVAAVQQALDLIAYDSLRPLLLGMVGLYLVFGLSHTLLLPLPIAQPMAATALITALAALLLRAVLGRRPRAPRRAHALLAALSATVAFNGLLHLALTGDLLQTTNVVLLLIAAGFFFLSTPWFLLSSGLALAGWLAVVLSLPAAPARTHFAFMLGSTALLALLVHLARVRTLRRIEVLRVRDIAQQQELQSAVQALQRSNAFSQRIINSSLDGIVAFDRSCRLTAWNPAMERLTGLARAQVLGVSAFELFPLLHESGADQLFSEALAGRAGVLPGQLYRSAQSGREIYFEAHYSPLQDEQGGVIGGLAVIQDITERRQAEEALRRAKDDAEQANAAKSQFLSRTSHELRTPLNGILGFAQLLELEQLAPPQRDYVEQILRGGRHLLHLINQLLEIANTEERLSLALEPVVVGELLRECVELLQPLMRETQIALAWAEDAVLAQPVQADRQRLKQVFLNVLANAIKYNRVGGTLSLEARVTAEQLWVVVRDTGIGIPPEKLARLFTPFDRLGAEQTAVEGTGLGLALSQHLIHAMHGQIVAESVPGKGSSFSIGLPLSAQPLVPAQPDRPSAPQPARRQTLLYIEDSLSNISLVERLLALRPGVRLLTAMQGGLGIELAREHQPDLILLDLHLPDLHGAEVLERLRQQPQTRGIPVVIISADVTPRQVERLLAAGAQAYLQKPFDVRQFLGLIDQWFSFSGAQPSP